MAFISEETVLELNHELAWLRYLAIHVGAGRKDTREMREKLTKTRRRCMDVCREARSAVPRDFDSDATDINDEQRKRLGCLCVGLQLLARELKIIQRLASTFPEKSVKSLFHYPTTFMLLDGSAARMMDGSAPPAGPSSAEALQIHRERREILELLKELGYDPHKPQAEHPAVPNTEDIYTDYRGRSFLRRGTCSIRNLLCCRRRGNYV